MSQGEFAKLFENGGSQAVRLPRAFRFKGERVRVRQTEQGVLLLPAFTNAGEWFSKLDAQRGERAKKKRKDRTR